LEKRNSFLNCASLKTYKGFFGINVALGPRTTTSPKVSDKSTNAAAVTKSKSRESISCSNSIVPKRPKTLSSRILDCQSQQFHARALVLKKQFAEFSKRPMKKIRQTEFDKLSLLKTQNLSIYMFENKK
jgi:hypothetical protein